MFWDYEQFNLTVFYSVVVFDKKAVIQCQKLQIWNKELHPDSGPVAQICINFDKK